MRSNLVRVALYSVGVALLLLSAAGSLSASVVSQAPEIDAGSLATGLGLAAAGVLILRSRRRSK